jgi:hypothetical protein
MCRACLFVLTWRSLPRKSHAQSASSEQPRPAQGREGAAYGNGSGGASDNNPALHGGSFQDSCRKGQAGGTRGGACGDLESSPRAGTGARTRQRAWVESGTSSPAKYSVAASRWREVITGEDPGGSPSTRSFSSLQSLKATDAAHIAVGKPHQL